MKFVYFFLTLALIGLVRADSAIYTIQDNEVLVNASLEESSTFVLPDNYLNLEVSSSYEILAGTLFIEVPANISFRTNDYLDKTSSENLFSLSNPIGKGLDLKVVLPKGSALSDRLTFPRGYSTSTDGKNIILEWKNLDEDEIIIFYESANSGDNTIYFILGVLLVGLVVLIQWLLFRKKVKKIQKIHIEKTSHLKKKTKGLVTKNLFGDERRIIEYLLKRKGNSCWTKEMVRDLNIPKVRLSRKIRILVEKGFVEKESHGNENRIKLIKKS